MHPQKWYRVGTGVFQEVETARSQFRKCEKMRKIKGFLDIASTEELMNICSKTFVPNTIFNDSQMKYESWNWQEMVHDLKKAKKITKECHQELKD